MSSPAVAQPAPEPMAPPVAPPAQLPSEAPETDFAAFVAEFSTEATDSVAPESTPSTPPTLPSAPPSEPAPTTTEPAKGAAPPRPEPSGTAPPSPAPQAATPPVGEVPAVPALPATPPPAAAPVQPPAAPQPPAVAQPPAAEKPLTEAELKAQRAELVTAFSSCYTLTPEDEALLSTEPNKVLPKLAGNLAADVFEATTRLIVGQIPAMIQRHLEGRDAAVKAREVFFTAFPELNKPEYLPVIGQVTELFRRMNPKAPYDAAAVQAIGKHASFMLGLAPSAGASPVGAPPTPPRPAAPLSPGAAAPSRPAPVGDNIFGQLATFEEVDE